MTRHWYSRLEKMHGEPPWPRFVKHLNRSFGPTIRTSRLAEVKRLKQTGAVKDYKRTFLTLVCRCESLTEEQQVELFVAGLRNPIRTDVDLQYPTNLEAAMSLALSYERHGLSDDEDEVTPPPAKVPSSKPAKMSGPATATPSKAAPAAAPFAAPGKKPFKCLTPAEMDDRRAEGLCYNCDEKFQRGHRCKNLFSACVVWDDMTSEAEETDSDNPEISLCALTGINNGTTMQLPVYVLGERLIALLNSGSTHNFFSEEAASRCGVAITRRDDIRVMVANGDTGQFWHLPWIGCHHRLRAFHGGLLHNSLGGFDVVLGVQWLGMLGPLLWDFKKLLLSFWRHGRRITWRGETKKTGTARAALCSGHDLLDELLLEYDSLFEMPTGLPPCRPV